MPAGLRLPYWASQPQPAVQLDVILLLRCRFPLSSETDGCQQQQIRLFYSLVRSFNFYGYQGIVDENRNVGIFITSYVTLEFETNLNPASKCQLLQSSILESESGCNNYLKAVMQNVFNRFWEPFTENM